MYTFRLLMSRDNRRTRINIRAATSDDAVRNLDPHWEDWSVMEIRRIK